MTNDSIAPLMPEDSRATPTPVTNEHVLTQLRRRTRMLTSAARHTLNTQQPSIERAVREAVALAQQAAIAGVTTTQPYVRKVARGIARRLDPGTPVGDRYEQALRELVDAISEPGSINFRAASSGYVLESGSDAGRMTTGIAYGARLSAALGHARDLLHAHTPGARHGDAPPAAAAADADRDRQ